MKISGPLKFNSKVALSSQRLSIRDGGAPKLSLCEGDRQSSKKVQFTEILIF